jgi:AcrR family transcriptional regulator
MSEGVKRQYDSTWRQEQARETRQRIIQAAHDLFLSQGYGSTTIADIARAAGIAVETVYSAFRNKHTLLRQVWYVSFRDDEEDIRLWDRPEIRTVIAERIWPGGLRPKRSS